MSAKRYRKTGLEQFAGGLGVFVVCCVLVGLHFVPGWVLVFGVFLGALPMVKGFVRIAGERRERIEDGRRDRDRLESRQRSSGLAAQQAILRQASRNGGVVTPGAVAMAADLPIELVDQTLQSMAARGIAVMNVRANGAIEYLISEFLD